MVSEVDGSVQIAVRGGDAAGAFYAIFTVHRHEIVKLISVVGAVHLLVTVTALLVSYAAGFDTFDGGAPESSLDRVSARAFQVLSFPLLTWFDEVPGIRRLFPGLLGYIPFAANSALWAAVICGLFGAARQLLGTRAGERVHSDQSLHRTRPSAPRR